MGHEHGAGGRQQYAGQAVVDALATDPDAPAWHIDSEEPITVCPWPGFVHICLTEVLFGSCGGGLEPYGVPAAAVTRSRRPAKEPPARGETTGSGPTATAPSATAPPADAPPPGGAEHRREDPESQPGGAGDEEAARSPAMFTGRGGKITPRVVRVPPYLAVRAELRSADGRDYMIFFGTKVLRNGKTLTLDGLRPGTKLRGLAAGGGNSVVVIEATAEPGP